MQRGGEQRFVFGDAERAGAGARHLRDTETVLAALGFFERQRGSDRGMGVEPPLADEGKHPLIERFGLLAEREGDADVRR